MFPSKLTKHEHVFQKRNKKRMNIAAESKFKIYVGAEEMENIKKLINPLVIKLNDKNYFFITNICATKFLMMNF